MIERKIKTRLVGKDELFKVIALGEATRMPILFVGVPGVAKTQTLIDYAAAMSGYDKQKARKETFVLELDEGTKSSEIKGRVNMQDLLVEKKYTIEAPIANARYVLINEMDKGSSAVRKTMLSVMREKALFLGSEIRQCKWQLFAGSCNVIPDDELENPFWDRFLITYEVNRIKVADIYNEAWKGNRYELTLNIPETSDLDATTLDAKMMKTFAKEIYKAVSDRTMIAVPEIVKAVKHIWSFGDAEAIMKACEFVCPDKVQALSAKLEDPAIVSVKTKIKELPNIEDSDVLMTSIQTIENEIAQLSSNPAYSEQAPVLETVLKDTIDKSENCQGLISSLQEKADKFKGLKGGNAPEKVESDGSVKVAE
jgi:MoxR-like ATPase